MRSVLAILFLIQAVVGVAHAETRPVPSREDPRVQTVRFMESQPVRLITSPGNDVAVLLAGDELVTNVNLSNHAAYQVTTAGGRGSFTLHTSMALAQGMVVENATMQIATDKRVYDFTLSSTPSEIAPVILRFTYGSTQRKSDATAASDEPLQYRLSGNRELLPTSIHDDGAKTYMQWAPDKAMPAVFALDRLGREEMVDGYMRSGSFTIDRVHERLVFRVDDIKAEARRRIEKASK